MKGVRGGPIQGWGVGRGYITGDGSEKRECDLQGRGCSGGRKCDPMVSVSVSLSQARSHSLMKPVTLSLSPNVIFRRPLRTW